MFLKDGYTLTPRSCDYVILHGKRDFTDEHKGLDMEKLSWIIVVSPLIGGRLQVGEKRRHHATGFEDGVRNHKPKNADGLYKLGKAKK